MERLTSLGLGQQISLLLVGPHVTNVQSASKNLFAKLVELHVDVLGAGVVNGVVSQGSS